MSQFGEVRKRVLQAVEEGATSRDEIITATGLELTQVQNAVFSLIHDGSISKVRRGVYAPAITVPQFDAPPPQEESIAKDEQDAEAAVALAPAARAAPSQPKALPHSPPKVAHYGDYIIIHKQALRDAFNEVLDRILETDPTT